VTKTTIKITSIANRRLLHFRQAMSVGENNAAPWRPLFNTHISKMDSPEFVLTSLEAAKDKDAPIPYVPRARTCVFRGMWAELPENKHNQAPRNHHVYESDLLTLTTDVRMDKIPQIVKSSKDHEEISGSGGGGPVEAVFWVKDVMTQWRFRGNAYIVGQDIEQPENSTSSGVGTVKQEIGERMRVIKQEGKDAWSWATELTAHFGNLSPGMRGRYVNVKSNPASFGVSEQFADFGSCFILYEFSQHGYVKHSIHRFLHQWRQKLGSSILTFFQLQKPSPRNLGISSAYRWIGVGTESKRSP